jgi:hypothetical protein
LWKAKQTAGQVSEENRISIFGRPTVTYRCDTLQQPVPRTTRLFDDSAVVAARLGHGPNLYDGISQPERYKVRSPTSAVSDPPRNEVSGERRYYLSAAFNSSATDLRISRDSLSSFTARAIDTAPTSVDKAASAFLFRALGVLPETNLVSSSR